jgi:hypothetical protein
MRWLRELILGRDTGQTPRYGAVRETPDPIDWSQVEDVLVASSERCLHAFAKRHGAESFYAMGFDCVAYEAQILLCLNTRDAQRDAARVIDGPFRDIRSRMSEEERLAQAEWGFGEWRHHGINLGKTSWEQAWHESRHRITQAADMLTMHGRHEEATALREAFLQTAARALLRLAASDGCAALRRDADFRVLCTDHDERVEAGFERLRRVASPTMS